MSSSMGRMTIYDHLNHLINLWKVKNMVWNQQPENIWKYEPCGILWAQLIHWEMHRWFSIGWEMPMSWQQTHAACESLPGRLVQRIGKPHGWSQKKACLWENMYFLAAKIWGYMGIYHDIPWLSLHTWATFWSYTGKGTNFLGMIFLTVRWLRGGYALPFPAAARSLKSLVLVKMWQPNKNGELVRHWKNAEICTYWNLTLISMGIPGS